MNKRLFCGSFLAISLCLGTVLYGGVKDKGDEQRPSIGVWLDPSPLPGLLTKHLGLAPGQGIRISNIAVGSPADKEGLERDDIIVTFQGKDVTDYEQFVAGVRKSGLGAEVELKVIHLGKSRSLTMKLEPAAGKLEWKYPSEPQMLESWQPGKILVHKPNQKTWVEVPFDVFPHSDIGADEFAKEVYTFHHATDEESYTITIRGNPGDKNAKIVVRAGDDVYETTAGAIESLPEKYRGTAKGAMNQARELAAKNKTGVGVRARIPGQPADVENRLREYFFGTQKPPVKGRPEMPEQTSDKLEKQMRQLQERVGELEKHNKEILDRLSELLQRDNALQHKDKPEQAQPKGKQAI